MRQVEGGRWKDGTEAGTIIKQALVRGLEAVQRHRLAKSLVIKYDTFWSFDMRDRDPPPL